MFSFHKPKIYRSIQGCCICRAKSSSSRFTDSKRYERDFAKCFEIFDDRCGEICNACVLLVKRWKKLPAGSTRNWRHVVDARAGPGTKSMNKIKNKAAGISKQDQLKDERFKKKHKHKRNRKNRVVDQVQKLGLVKPPLSPSTFSDDVGDECLSEDFDYLSNSDASDDEGSARSTNTRSQSSNKTGSSSRRKNPNPVHFSSFLDLNYWKKTEICCGIIFKGSNGEVLIDPSLMHPCRSCKRSNRSSRHTSESNDSCQSDVYTSSSSNSQQDVNYLQNLPHHIKSQHLFTSAAQITSMIANGRGGSADTNPPTPVEVEPMIGQAQALCSLSAHTPTYTDECHSTTPTTKTQLLTDCSLPPIKKKKVPTATLR